MYLLTFRPRNGYLCILFAFVAAFGCFAQSEDSLVQKMFGHEDLIDIDADKNKIITSANLLSENYEDLPQEVIVVDGDDIRKFGYTTLVDVLKSIPGFRTSQPGNALEGETFLMRGLYGNDHAKILINGIPIKPEAVKGMPIASQLPIRHAERIEIVMGPSAAAYGSDAMAGVINIVLAEVDRPVFAWADINLMNNRASEFNLTLGGKIGTGKNILNYQLFASSYKAQGQNLLMPDDSIRLFPNQLDDVQLSVLAVNPEDKSLPEVDDLPKESRLVGGNLRFRWFEMSLMNMYRSEQSGIGSFPTVASYQNPNSFIGENINSFALKYQDEKEKRFTNRVLFSTLFYRTLSGSSTISVNNFLSNGTNYLYARSFDMRGEYQGIFKVNKHSNLVVGGVGQYSISHAFTNYLAAPFKFESVDFSIPSNLQSLTTGTGTGQPISAYGFIDTVTHIPIHQSLDLSGFVQYSYISPSKKVNFVAGTRIDLNDLEEIVFTPKVGVMYRPIPSLKLRAYYGQGHRAPSSFYIYNHYSESTDQLSNGELLKRRQQNLKSEELRGGEIGIDWKPNDHWSLGMTYFMHRLENRVLRQIRISDTAMTLPNGESPTVGFSYFNGESHSTLHSMMTHVNYKKQLGKVMLKCELNYQYARGWETVETRLFQQQGTIGSTDTSRLVPGYRFMPVQTIKANVYLNFYGFTLGIKNQLFGDYISDIFGLNSEVIYSSEPKYFYNMDISLHKTLFRQLSVMGGINNVFHGVQSGIPHVGITSSWAYNPQLGRVYRIGLSFKLN